MKVNPERLPDPPRVFFSAEAAKQYKMILIEATLRELKEPVEVLRHQAMLTRDERAHRVEADKRADAAERLVAERVEAVEQAAQERAVAFERKATDYVQNVERTARAVLEENRELRRENQDLRSERNRLNDSLMKAARANLDYPGEQRGQAVIYRGDRNIVAMRIEQQKAFDSNNKLICRNSVDLVIHMREYNEGVEGFSKDDAISWLRDEFGDKRAAGAAPVHREHEVLEIFERRREERERTRPCQERDDSQRAQGSFERTRQEELSHEREGYSFDR